MDLPDPLGPLMAAVSPGEICKSMFLKANRSPVYWKETPLTTIPWRSLGKVKETRPEFGTVGSALMISRTRLALASVRSDLA